MAEASKSILVTNYEKISEVARILYVYGCYSNVDFDDNEIRERINNSLINSKAAFRKEREPIDVVLENSVKKVQNMNAKKQYYISPDRFEEEVVSLVKIYRLCTLKSMINPVSDYINFLYKLVYSDKVNNRKEMTDYFGADTEKNSLFYLEIGKSRLSVEELSQLYSALMFFNGKAPYAVPGYFACDRINDYLKMSGEELASDNANTVFNYNNIDRILNDNAVYSIFEAIKHKKWISFIYRNPELEKLKNLSESEKTNNKKAFLSERKKCFPLRIMYEFQEGRGYLIGWDLYYKKTKHIRTYRLDDIFDVELENKDEFSEDMNAERAEKLINEEIEEIWLSISKDNDVVIDFDENAENIKREVPIGKVIPVSDNSCRFEARVKNFKDIVPFVRRFGEKAHISKEKSPELYEYVKNDLRKALEKYESF